MFVENKMGFSIDIGDYDRLAAVIIDLYNRPEQIDQMVENAYIYGVNNYSSDKSIAKILDVFDKTANTRG